MLLLLMPIKYQPDYIYLRHVQTSRVHYFTLIQITCSAVMWAIKSVKATSIAFPLMVCRPSSTSLTAFRRRVSNQSFSCDVLARTVSDVSVLVLDSECMLLCVLL